MGVLTSGQIAAMRTAASGLMPDVGTNSRTAEECAVWVFPDGAQTHLPGLSPLVSLRRWRLSFPALTDVVRGDTITVPDLGTYFVVDVLAPESYEITREALAYQTLDVAGASVLPFTANATVSQYRAGSQVGSSRRVRFVPGMPGQIGPSGERVPDIAYTTATDSGWRINDILVLVSIDGFSTLPHPSRLRVQAPVFVAEPPSYIALELSGEAGTG